MKVSGKLARLLLATLLLVAVAAPLAATPPPMPRFSVKNNTPYTIAGTFQVHYIIENTNQGWYHEISGPWAPGGYSEKAFPHRLKFEAGKPYIAFVTGKTAITANGTVISGGSYLPYFSTNRQTDPKIGTAHGKPFYVRVVTGDDASGLVWVDLTITN